MEILLEKLKAPLDISDVDFRIQSINNGGYATILAYKNARVDMNRLDEVCGLFWQKTYQTIDGNLYCSVGIKINDEWVWKQDVGTESFSDKEKGQASDAFKRACFNWGIGRELYEYPKIQVRLLPNEFKNESGKVKQTYELQLDKWVWTSEFKDGKIIFLQAIDNNGTMRFTYNSTQPISFELPQTNSQGQNKPKLENKEDNINWASILKRIKEGKTIDINVVKEHFDLTPEAEKELIKLTSNDKQ